MGGQAMQQLTQILDKEKEDRNLATQQLMGTSQQIIGELKAQVINDMEKLRILVEQETENRNLLVRSLGDSHAKSQEMMKELVLAKANELNGKVEEEARQRNGLRDGISSEHKAIYAKLNEHSVVSSDLQRQIENNERCMRGKFIDHDSTQQSLRECTQRLADNQKSVDDKVNNLIIGVSPATDRTMSRATWGMQG